MHEEQSQAWPSALLRHFDDRSAEAQGSVANLSAGCADVGVEAFRRPIQADGTQLQFEEACGQVDLGRSSRTPLMYRHAPPRSQRNSSFAGAVYQSQLENRVQLVTEKLRAAWSHAQTGCCSHAATASTVALSPLRSAGCRAPLRLCLECAPAATRSRSRLDRRRLGSPHHTRRSEADTDGFA
jgi:hypothetical protein